MAIFLTDMQGWGREAVARGLIVNCDQLGTKEMLTQAEGTRILYCRGDCGGLNSVTQTSSQDGSSKKCHALTDSTLR